MSKKDKSKFRKRLRAQILQDMSQVQTKEEIAPQAPIIQTQTKPDIVSEMKTEQPKAKIDARQTQEKTYIDLPQIKNDLRRTAIVVGSFIVAIAALAIIDTKTNALLSFRDFVFKILHIQ